MFRYPRVSVSDKSNEQNIQELKSFCCEMVDELNYEITKLSNRVDELEAALNASEGEG